MGTHYVQLEFATPQPYPVQDRYCFRLRVSVIDTREMPFEIFLHKQIVVDQVTDLRSHSFVSVCGPFELSRYPANAPEEQPTTLPAFYRLSYFDVVLPSLEACDDVIATVKILVDELCRAADRNETLSLTSQRWSPADPD